MTPKKGYIVERKDGKKIFIEAHKVVIEDDRVLFIEDGHEKGNFKLDGIEGYREYDPDIDDPLDQPFFWM